MVTFYAFMEVYALKCYFALHIFHNLYEKTYIQYYTLQKKKQEIANMQDAPHTHHITEKIKFE